MSNYQLKIIAIITMIIDHIGIIFFPHILIFRIIGRISFPIFCFLLVQGFLHTSNFRKYFFRLLVFAFISELPYDLLFNFNSTTRILDSGQNIFFTLALGLLMLHYLQYLKKDLFSQICLVAASCLISFCLNFSYNYLGILMILFFYIFQEKKNFLLSQFILCFFSPFQFFSMLSYVFIFRSNYCPGRKSKYIFYIIYPVHLFILYFINLIYI